MIFGMVVSRHRFLLSVIAIVSLFVVIFVSRHIKLVPDREVSYIKCENGSVHNFNHPLLRNYSEGMMNDVATGKLLMSNENASRLCGDADGNNKVTVRTDTGGEYHYIINYAPQIVYKKVLRF